MKWFKKTYTVKLIGRCGLIYEEGNHSLFVDTEMLCGPEYDMVLFTDSLHFWRNAGKEEVINEEHRERICNNIEKELTKHRIKWLWQ